MEFLYLFVGMMLGGSLGVVIMAALVLSARAAGVDRPHLRPSTSRDSVSTTGAK